MNEPRRTPLDRVRDALSVLARHLAEPTGARLVPAHSAIRPGQAATRGGWLLLADGRPTLRVRRHR